MKSFILGLYIFFILLIQNNTYCQDSLTLKDALEIALKNNFDIKIAGNMVQSAKINNSTGNAGGLPGVAATASDNLSYTSVYQELADGRIIERPLARTNALNAGVNAIYVLFNGFKFYATKKRLAELQKQSEYNLINQINNTCAQVINQYTLIITQTQYLDALKTIKELSEKKIDLVKTKKSIGMASEADILQATLDLNTSSQNYSTQQMTVKQHTIDLFTLLQWKDFAKLPALNDSITIDTTLTLEKVDEYIKSNPQMQYAEQQVVINQQIVKELGAQRLPSLRLNAGVNVTNISNEAGILLVQQAVGPSVGASLNIPIYYGKSMTNQRKTAELSTENAVLQRQNLAISLQSGAQKTYEAYRNALSQMTGQLQTVTLANKLYKLMYQKYELNQATFVDIKTAQSTYESALFRYYLIRYQAKIAETELKRLSGACPEY
ncbi:MAG: TolC family protein [Cytophagales bacterium]|nr:TolC family protein [Cytophagales bacterium]